MDNKKLAAAIAAVYAHLTTCEPAVASQSEIVPEQEISFREPVSAPNLWGLSGRQYQMQANSMIQWRAFK